MKNFISRLTLALTISIVISVMLTAIFKLAHITQWTQFVALTAGLIISVGIIYFLKIVRDYRIAIVIGLIPAGVNLPLHNWLFYSADEVVMYADVQELSKPENNALYFDLENYYYNTDGMGSLEITKTTKRRGRTSETKTVYSVVPIVADSASNTVKAWMIFDMPAAKYDRINDADELLKLDDILCYERITEELDDYIEATTYSDFKDAEGAVFIRPLYKAFITKSEWRSYFLASFAAALVLMAIIGLILNIHAKKAAIKAAKEAELMAQAEAE